MNKFKAPKPQQPRTKSLPSLTIKKSPKTSIIYSKAAIKQIQTRSIPEHEFNIQPKPRKRLNFFYQSIFTSCPNTKTLQNSPKKLKNPVPAPDSYFYFCNIKITHKKARNIPKEGLFICSNPAFSSSLQ